MVLVEFIHPMPTSVALRCPLCGGELAPNEAGGTSACPHGGGTQMHDASDHGNRVPPRGAALLVSLAKKGYRALPKSLRVSVSPITFYLYDLLNTLRPQVWIFTGDMQGSLTPISVCVYTQSAETRSYVSRLFFGPDARSRYLGRSWVWNTQKLPKAARECSVVFSEIEARFLRYLRAGCGMVIPSWVRGEAELPRSAKQLRRRSVEPVRRKIRQNSLEYEITTDQARFDDFFDNMYLPYITKRYGDSGHVAPRKRVQAAFDRGELLMVKKQGEHIAGQLIFYEGSTACMAWIGVRDGKWEYVRDGAQLALYEFTFRRVEEQGCRKLDMTRSRPFLNDGVLRLKRAWSQRIVEAASNKFLMRIVSDSDATRAFLEKMPFLFESFGEFLGAFFVKGETPLTLEALQRIGKDYFHDGMSRLVVFQFSPQSTTAESEFAATPLSGLSAIDSRDPTGTFRYQQLSRADWADLIRGLGFTGIGRAIAICPRDQDRKARLQTTHK